MVNKYTKIKLHVRIIHDLVLKRAGDEIVVLIVPFIIWGNATQKALKELTVCQNKVIRIIHLLVLQLT